MPFSDRKSGQFYLLTTLEYLCGNISAYIHLFAVICHLFGRFQQIPCYIFIYIIFTTIRAHLGRHLFNNEGKAIPLQSNGCCSKASVMSTILCHFEGVFTTEKS
jgi:hypothetical protein